MSNQLICSTKKGHISVAPLVELPRIETGHLPGKMNSELLFRYVSSLFSPVRYLRFRLGP